MPRSCAVALCENYGLITEGIIYHSFPKNVVLRERWVKACHRKETINPNTSSVCSIHFTESDYEDDMRNRLLGLPQKKKLKIGAIPSRFVKLNEPAVVEKENLVNVKQIQHRQIIDDLLLQSPESNNTEPVSLPPQPITESSTTVKSNVDYEVRYNSLRQEFNELQKQFEVCKKTKNAKIKSLSSHLSYYKKKVESLRNEKENLKGVLKKCFSVSQINALSQKKKRVNWSKDDLSFAFTLNNYSTKAYTYLRDLRNYPLPGVSTLRKWAAISGKYPGILNAATNTEDKLEQKYSMSTAFKRTNLEVTPQKGIIDDIKSDLEALTGSSTDITLYENSKNTFPAELPKDFLENIAGYLAQKFKTEYPNLGERRHQTWEHECVLSSQVQKLSHGELTKPSAAWLNEVREYDEVFCEFHGPSKFDFSKELDVVESVVSKIKDSFKTKDMTISGEDILLNYVKIRTLIHQNYSNIKSIGKCSIKRKINGGDGTAPKKRKIV